MNKSRPHVVKSRKAMVAKVSSAVLQLARSYLERNGFIWVLPPHITRAGGSCENVNTLFDLNYFGRRAYLAQTGQLYLETLIPSLRKVWCISRSFRAEPRADKRHLTEFTLLEMEFCGDFEQLLRHMENMIYEIVTKLPLVSENELIALDVDMDRLRLIKRPFMRISYGKVIKILRLKWGSDLRNKNEKQLVEMFGDQPLFLTHFPESIKFFNMRTNSQNPNSVNSADLLLPVSGEAAGAGEREYEYHTVIRKLKQSEMFRQFQLIGVNLDDFAFYLDHLKHNGSVLHSGCGIGIERVVQFILGSDDIRLASVFPLNSETLI